MFVLSLLKNFLKRRDGATAIEYGLISLCIALAIIPAVQHAGGETSTVMATIADGLAEGPAGIADGGGPPLDIGGLGSCTPQNPCGGGDD